MPRLTWVLLAFAALIIGVYVVLVFLVQRSLLFPIPQRAPRDVNGRADVIRWPVEGGDALGLFLPPRQSATPAPLIIFTHGNGELADDWLAEFEAVREWGAAVLLVEYPGYGRAPGSPSERSIVAAMHAAYEWAAGDPRIDRDRIVAYGRSLGASAAARLAADRKVAALVLESAFTSVADFASRFFAPGFLIRDPFDNRKALGRYRGPLLMIHGTRDTIVPIEHGRALAALVPGSRFHEVDCGHNDCPRQWEVIRGFLENYRVL